MNEIKRKDVLAPFSEKWREEKELFLIDVIKGNPAGKVEDYARELDTTVAVASALFESLEKKRLTPAEHGLSPFTEDLCAYIGEKDGVESGNEAVFAEFVASSFHDEQTEDIPAWIQNAANAHLGTATNPETALVDAKQFLGADDTFRDGSRCVLCWYDAKPGLEEELSKRPYLQGIFRKFLGRTCVDTAELVQANFPRPPQSQMHKIFAVASDELVSRGLARVTRGIRGVAGLAPVGRGPEVFRNIFCWRSEAPIREMKRRHIPQAIRCPNCGESTLQTNFRYQSDSPVYGEMFDTYGMAASGNWSKSFSDHDTDINCIACSATLVDDKGRIIADCLTPIVTDTDE